VPGVRLLHEQREIQPRRAASEDPDSHELLN
jgi:hypothetical protein